MSLNLTDDLKCRVRADQVQALQAIAAEREISVSDVIREAVREYLRRHRPRKPKSPEPEPAAAAAAA